MERSEIRESRERRKSSRIALRFIRATRARRLSQRRVGGAEHRARLVAAAALDIDDGGIDAVAGNIFQRNGPASRTAVPVADLHEIAHHIVVSELLAAILAAPDRNQHLS